MTGPGNWADVGLPRPCREFPGECRYSQLYCSRLESTQTRSASFDVAPLVRARRAIVTRSVSEGTGCDRVRPSLTLRVTMAICRQKAPRATSKSASEVGKLFARLRFGLECNASNSIGSGTTGQGQAAPRRTPTPRHGFGPPCPPERGAVGKTDSRRSTLPPSRTAPPRPSIPLQLLGPRESPRYRAPIPSEGPSNGLGRWSW